jgi:hypothetical protein
MDLANSAAAALTAEILTLKKSRRAISPHLDRTARSLAAFLKAADAEDDGRLLSIGTTLEEEIEWKRQMAFRESRRRNRR